jgi:hypothetical protein
VLGINDAAGRDDLFRHLVLAWIIEPVSKLDSIRVLDVEEAGVASAPYRTIVRRLPAYAKDAWRQRLSAACGAHVRLGPASLVLYDVSTLLCRRRHRRSTLRLTGATGSASPGFPRSAGWSRGSPSAC